MEYLNYLLLILGAIAVMLILLGKAKKREDYSFGKFFFRNWYHVALNIVFGVAVILSDGRLLNSIYEHWGDMTYFALGGAGGTVAKFLFDALEWFGEKFNEVWKKIIG